MKINETVFEKVKKQKGEILVVTKYLEKETTEKVLTFCEKKYADIFLGLGENRIEILETKKLPREKVHFIGNIQSKKIPKIVQFSSVVHSLENLNHAKFLNREMQKQFPKETLKIFLQIKLDSEKNSGILPNDFEKFLEKVQVFKNLEICGISGMGKYIASEKEKVAEFLLLKKLRDLYLSGKKISAGTSQDFEKALKEGINIVRVGRKIIE